MAWVTVRLGGEAAWCSAVVVAVAICSAAARPVECCRWCRCQWLSAGREEEAEGEGEGEGEGKAEEEEERLALRRRAAAAWRVARVAAFWHVMQLATASLISSSV